MDKETTDNWREESARLERFETFLNREVVKLNRHKSDTVLRMAELAQKVLHVEGEIVRARRNCESIAKVIACLVEEFYIQSLVDVSLENCFYSQ